MKWVSIFIGLLIATSFHSTQAGPPHRGFGRGYGYGHGRGSGAWGYDGYPFGYSQPCGAYGLYGGSGLYGGYAYPGSYPSLYPYGIYHRPFPYYSYYYGAYPYLYNYGYRSGAYTVYSTAGQEGYIAPRILQILQYPVPTNDLEDVDKTWAWGYLAEGNFNRAETIFAAMERQTPAAGWPKIGNGLLAGFSGDHNKALYQFRRAFRFDSSDPGRLPAEQELQQKVQRLTDHFKRAANNGHEPDPDAEFMVAALAFLSGDPIGAQNAIEKAVLHGDKSRSARNLKGLVDNVLQERNDELFAVEGR